MSRAIGASLLGVDGVAVEVEVVLSSQLPRVDMVGLPEPAVRESSARIRAAIAAAGERFPDRRITVNLAPASLRKGGAALDLPIALGVLGAAAAVPAAALDGVGLVGELSLDGRLRPVRGALALVQALCEAGCRRVVVPADNADEAALAEGVRVHPAPDLVAVLHHLRGGRALPVAREGGGRARRAAGPDLADVRGQERAKRALLVAAAGGHALLLSGPPGAGKTMLARRLAPLLPPLEPREVREATRIHGAAGRLDAAQPLVLERPFRAPHHTASAAGLLGGGSPPQPGEVSLAHAGVLFLDELPEFERRALEGLRQVVEEGRVVLARATARCSFPARFQLVAAANPCPCGWRFSPRRSCVCDDAAVARYAARVSGPLLDRIDLHVEVPAVPWKDLDAPPAGGSLRSTEAREAVARARARQRARLAGTGAATNAGIPDPSLDALVAASARARSLLGRAVDRLGLSARAARRVLRVARTIADLEDAPRVEEPALAEALGYRERGAD